MLLSIFMIISNVHISLYEERSSERQVILDEATVMFLLYHLACVTSFVAEIETKLQVGMSMIIFTATVITVRILMLIFESFKLVYKRLRLLYSAQKNVEKY